MKFKKMIPTIMVISMAMSSTAFAGTWKTESEIKVIKNTQRLQKYFGYKLARNIAEYADAYSNLKLKGIIQLTNKKIERRKK
mgnify:CR=1 FL=1